MLSIGGRLTLLKFVLGSLGMYYMSLFKMLVQIVKMLEQIREKKFWGLIPMRRS